MCNCFFNRKVRKVLARFAKGHFYSKHRALAFFAKSLAFLAVNFLEQ